MRINEKLKLFLNIKKELEIVKSQLEEVTHEFHYKQTELELIEEEITKKKIELQTLKRVIDLNLNKENEPYDYKVNISDCYIVNINGKKYISLKKRENKRSDWYTLATGHYNIETHKYYDALNVDENNNYKYIYEYKCGYFDNPGYCSTKYTNTKPHENHILEVYPELKIFTDDLVPNTYLKKIYYIENEVGTKQMVKNNNSKGIL